MGSVHQVTVLVCGFRNKQGPVRYCRTPARVNQRTFDGRETHVENVGVLKAFRFGAAIASVHRQEIAITFLIIGSFKLADLIVAYEYPVHGRVIGPHESAEQMTICAVVGVRGRDLEWLFQR